MPNFEELLEMLRNPGESGLPDDFADQLAQAHTDVTSAADAKVKQLETTIETSNASISELKAHNYDLMRSMPSNDGDSGLTSGPGDTEGADDFEDLFQ